MVETMPLARLSGRESGGGKDDAVTSSSRRYGGTRSVGAIGKRPDREWGLGHQRSQTVSQLIELGRFMSRHEGDAEATGGDGGGTDGGDKEASSEEAIAPVQDGGGGIDFEAEDGGDGVVGCVETCC